MGIGILRFESVTVTSYHVMTTRLCSENLSQEKTPQVCGCVEPPSLQLSFALEWCPSILPCGLLSSQSAAIRAPLSDSVSSVPPTTDHPGVRRTVDSRKPP